MTTPGGKAARQARAAQLHKRIDGITGTPDIPDEAAPKEPPSKEAPPANPRDFIAKRMRELAPRKK
jgi:hypothetical protein